MGLNILPAAQGLGENGRHMRDPFVRSAWSATSPGLASRNHKLAEELTQLHGEHDELRRTVLEAAQMQRKLCGPRLLRRGAYTLTGELFPVRHVSGDFITILERESHIVFAIGDIAGKGLLAGMWFTHMVGLIRMSVGNGAPDAAQAMKAINRELCNVEFAPPISSLFLASLDLETEQLTYCNAGHPPSLILRNSGTVEPLEIGGPILGAVPEAEYAAAQIRLMGGDSLLSYSDGLVECRNPQDEEFGTERLLVAARHAQFAPATGKLFSLLGAVEDFAGAGRREDDFAVLLLHRDETGA